MWSFHRLRHGHRALKAPRVFGSRVRECMRCKAEREHRRDLYERDRNHKLNQAKREIEAREKEKKR